VLQNDEIPADPHLLPAARVTIGSSTSVSIKAALSRPPMLRMIAASPGCRPGMSKGSTRGSKQPTMMVLVDGMIFRAAEKPAMANAALRSMIVSRKSLTASLEPRRDALICGTVFRHAMKSSVGSSSKSDRALKAAW
jgi:hypothetical protein